MYPGQHQDFIPACNWRVSETSLVSGLKVTYKRISGNRPRYKPSQTVPAVREVSNVKSVANTRSVGIIRTSSTISP